jgi:hypothetical protein
MIYFKNLFLQSAQVFTLKFLKGTELLLLPIGCFSQEQRILTAGKAESFQTTGRLLLA